jgi:hypothetical protein
MRPPTHHDLDPFYSQKLTTRFKTPHHNSRPRNRPLNPKLLLLPSHVPPRALSVPRKGRTTPVPLPPRPPLHQTLQTTSPRPGYHIQTRQSHRTPNQHAHNPPAHGPPPTLRLAPHPALLFNTFFLSPRPLPPRRRAHPMPRLHPLSSPRKHRIPNRPPHPPTLHHNIPLQPPP